MSHMVIFRTPEGKPGYQPAETVNDAVAVVERLRNDEGVENVRIFRLEEVQFELRPYFKVELAGGGTVESSDETPADGAPAPAIFGGSTDTDTDDESHPAPVAEVHDEADASDSTDGDQAVPPPPSAAHPPWAAPPPPPASVAPPAPAAHESSGEPGDDDEFSAAGQRRGLFGR